MSSPVILIKARVLFLVKYDAHVIKTLELLIQNGAKLDAKDDNGQTPIHLAALRMRSSWIEMLVRYGASLKSRTKYGLTPLEYALKANATNMEPKLKCIKALCYKDMIM